MDGPENIMGYQPWRPARDIIDWSIPGTSIFDRKKPLADATIRRIAFGIEKYWKDYAKPFLALLYGTSKVQSLDTPLSAVTASGAHHALVEPFVITVNHSGSDTRHFSLARTMPTICAGGNSHGLVEPLLTDFQFLNKPYPVSNPLGTIVTKSHIGLLDPSVYPRLDIRFRMLKNHELKKAQGFPDDYVITGNATEQTKQIGNAVPVNTAKALALGVIQYAVSRSVSQE
jgi:DNA (cytosine-5)-methyltransferase 1